jgi:hypothetical protein
VGGVAAEERLVGDHEARSLEHDAGRRIERDRGPVLARLGLGGEALELGAAGADDCDLVAPDERHVDVPRAGGPEPVRPVDGRALPDAAEAAGATVPADANRVQLAGRGISVRAAGRALLHHQQRAAIRVEDDPRRPELASVELGIGEPDPRPAAAGRDAPDDRLTVVGDVERSVPPPCCVVRHRRLVAHARRAAARLVRTARRQIAKPRVLAELVPAQVQEQRAGRDPVQQDQSPPRVARRHLDALALGQVLAGHAPAPQEGPVARVLAHPRRAAVANRVLVRALVNAAVGRHVRAGREARLADQREDARVPARPVCGRHGERDAHEQDPECHERGESTPHSSSRISLAARSPERTAPSM